MATNDSRPDSPAPDTGQLRAAMEAGADALASLAPPSPDPSTYLGEFPELSAVTTRDVTIPGLDGNVPGRLYRHPTVPAKGALVWAHGGGFAAGDLDMPEAHWVSLMLAAQGTVVLSLDYRKAVGGVHYPAPSDDVLAGWLWAVQHRAELVAATGPLHLGGASAGASLAAGVAKRLRDGAGELPSSLLLVYPTLHPDVPPASAELEALTSAIREAVPPGLMQLMSLNYAGTAAVLEDSYAFPGLGNVAGLPPTYILNSEVDLLRPSGEAFGADLKAAGVEVTLEYEPGSGHGHLNEPLSDAAQRSIDRMAAWLAVSGDRG
jgi:acetyl esterase